MTARTPPAVCLHPRIQMKKSVPEPILLGYNDANMLEVVELKTPLIGPVSLSAEGGECVAILGPSGSGKSLFLRAVVDLDPNEGAARLGGHHREQIPAPEWRRRVAMVPSESGWWADRVADHFEDRQTARQLLDTLGLPDALNWEVGRLSTGEKQRAALARALCNKPEALLLDEPTAALDLEATRRVEVLIREQCNAGIAVVLVTHDRDQAMRLASRHFVMARGIFKSAGATDP